MFAHYAVATMMQAVYQCSAVQFGAAAEIRQELTGGRSFIEPMGSGVRLAHSPGRTRVRVLHPLFSPTMTKAWLGSLARTDHRRQAARRGTRLMSDEPWQVPQYSHTIPSSTQGGGHLLVHRIDFTTCYDDEDD